MQMLIMEREKDWNVPILDSERLYQMLCLLVRTMPLVVYPGENHGIRRPSLQKDRCRRHHRGYDVRVNATTVGGGEE